MIQPSGQMTVFPSTYTLADAAEALAAAPAGTVLVQGSTADLEAMAARVRLGHSELERRAARRKTQRASRRRNRPS
jgi:hypothetical protein